MINEETIKNCLPDSFEAYEEDLIQLAMQRQMAANVILSCFVGVFEKGTRNVLLVQLGDYARGSIGGNPWTLPGGSVEPGEDPRIAVAREVLEESGVAVTSGELRLSAWIARPYATRGNEVGEITLLFRAETERQESCPNQPEIVDSKWEPFDLRRWIEVPSTGEGAHSLQPLRRHWIYWTQQTLTGQIGFMSYPTASELKMPPVYLTKIL